MTIELDLEGKPVLDTTHPIAYMSFKDFMELCINPIDFNQIYVYEGGFKLSTNYYHKSARIEIYSQAYNCMVGIEISHNPKLVDGQTIILNPNLMFTISGVKFLFEDWQWTPCHTGDTHYVALPATLEELAWVSHFLYDVVEPSMEMPLPSMFHDDLGVWEDKMKRYIAHIDVFPFETLKASYLI